MRTASRVAQICVLVVLGWFLALPSVESAEIRVLAASSLTESLRAIGAKYESAQAHRDKIILNLGASSTLARQIEEGAPADIFFSADESKMDALEKKGLIVKASRKSFLSNQLVIVVAAENDASINSPEDLASREVKRIALGDPKTVPIGVYARAYLEKLGLWKKIQAKIVITENVRAALAAVEAGNAGAAIVYKTDAAISRKVKIGYAVPPEEGPRISYPVALVKAEGNRAPAEQFLQYLSSSEALKVFARYGFLMNEHPR